MDEYVRNVWYMVAWEDQIPDGGVLARTILDEPMAFYRKRDGSGYVGLIDRCPHRFAPLSMGKREGDDLICGYHGLRFDQTGACVHNPYSDLIPPHCAVGSFAMEARDRIVWMWAGRRDEADPSLIPDFSLMGSDVPQGRGHIRFEANYELLTDNLMDLSHLEFVHTGTFGGTGVLFRGSYSAAEEDGAIWSRWWMPDTRPAWATYLPPDMKTDHWFEMRWQAPACMLLEIGLCPAGEGREAATVPPIRGPHMVTPETRTSSHYFYAFAQYRGEVTDDTIGKAFKEEDQPMIEAAQRTMGSVDFWDRKPVILNVDGGAVRARRRLMAMRREEARMPEQAESVAAE